MAVIRHLCLISSYSARAMSSDLKQFKRIDGFSENNNYSGLAYLASLSCVSYSGREMNWDLRQFIDGNRKQWKQWLSWKADKITRVKFLCSGSSWRWRGNWFTTFRTDIGSYSNDYSAAADERSHEKSFCPHLYFILALNMFKTSSYSGSVYCHSSEMTSQFFFSLKLLTLINKLRERTRNSGKGTKAWQQGFRNGNRKEKWFGLRAPCSNFMGEIT